MSPRNRVPALEPPGRRLVRSARVATALSARPTPRDETPTPRLIGACAPANLGVLTPMHCVPVIAGPWSPGAAITTLDDVKALDGNSKCSCAWTGIIEITDPGSAIDIE